MKNLAYSHQDLTEIHYGQIVELRVRKEGYNITELSRLAHVERRTVYNWFNQKYLKTEIIHRIGCILDHDFSEEFPSLFTKADFKKSTIAKKSVERHLTSHPDPESQVWKNRYIILLEEYNRALISFANLKEKNFAELHLSELQE